MPYPFKPGDRDHTDEHDRVHEELAAMDATTAARVVDTGTATGAALARTFVAFGDTEPTSPPGAEVVWFQTDGAGNVIDILSGVIE